MSIELRALASAVLLIPATVAFPSGSAGQEPPPVPGSWDREVNSRTIGPTIFHAPDLKTAWTEFSQAHLVRSIVVLPVSRFRIETPIHMRVERSTVAKHWAALVDRSPEFALGRDPATEILWIYPKQQTPGTLIEERICVDRGWEDARFYSDVLIELRRLLAPRLRVDPLSRMWRNTFDFPVTIPPGNYRLDELLSRALAADPTKSLALFIGQGTVHLVPVNLVRPETPVDTVGSLAWWDLVRGIAENDWDPRPNRSDLLSALGHPSVRMRRAARILLRMQLWHTDWLEWLESVKEPEAAAWPSLALHSVMVREPIDGPIAQCDDEFLASADPQLGLACVVELARFGTTEGAISRFDRLVSPDGHPDDALTEVRPLLWGSERARNAVKQHLPPKQAEAAFAFLDVRMRLCPSQEPAR